jgi:hypothetical protein
MEQNKTVEEKGEITKRINREDGKKNIKGLIIREKRENDKKS